MREEHRIVAQVYAAKEDIGKADALIREYQPFIRSAASRATGRVCTEQDDAFSIAMIAFHEAIGSYDKSRGAFLNYAATCIRSRLVDDARKEARHQGNVSLYAQSGEDGPALYAQLADTRDHYEESAGLQATKREIAELAAVMADFGVSFTDVAEASPKQDRTMAVCRQAVAYAIAHPELLDQLLRTKKLPLAKLALGAGADRKTLERHRKYVLVMLLIQTNGYESIRGHLRHVFQVKGGSPV